MMGKYALARFRVYLTTLVVLAVGSLQLLSMPLASAASVSSSTASAVPPSTPAGAKKNVVTFGTQTSSATKPDGRGYFSFAATPGGRVLDHVAILNYSNQKITLTVRGADAINTPQGGFAVLPINEPSKDIGTWIALPSADLSVTLPPRSDLIIPFLIEVPQNATPGDHIGAITATLQSFVISKSGQRVRLLQSVGTRIFLRVSGPLRPKLTVTDLKIHFSGTLNPIGEGKGEITYTVNNVGNVGLGGRQTVYVSGLLGSKKVALHVAEVQLLLPGFSVKETVHISGIIPEIREAAHVSVAPLYIPGTVQPASGPYTAAVSFWAVPWLTIVLVLIILAGLWWLVRRRRKGKGPDKEDGQSSTPAETGEQNGTDVLAGSTASPAQEDLAPVASAERNKTEEVE